MELILDRICGSTAYIETPDGTIREIDAALLPAGCQEGDVLLFENGFYQIDRHKTQCRKKSADDLLQLLKHRKK